MLKYCLLCFRENVERLLSPLDGKSRGWLQTLVDSVAVPRAFILKVRSLSPLLGKPFNYAGRLAAVAYS